MPSTPLPRRCRPGRPRRRRNARPILRRWSRSRHRRDREPRPADDHRAGAATRRIRRRGGLRRLLHRVVRGGGEARDWAHHPDHPSPSAYLTIKQPIGVVAVIAPWNFPIAMITRKWHRARRRMHHRGQARGGDPPPRALAIAKLALDAGVPPGVLNIVTTKDAAAVGKVLRDDGRVRKPPSPARPRSARCSIGNAPTR